MVGAWASRTESAGIDSSFAKAAAPPLCARAGHGKTGLRRSGIWQRRLAYGRRITTFTTQWRTHGFARIRLEHDCRSFEIQHLCRGRSASDRDRRPGSEKPACHADSEITGGFRLGGKSCSGERTVAGRSQMDACRIQNVGLVRYSGPHRNHTCGHGAAVVSLAAR